MVYFFCGKVSLDVFFERLFNWNGSKDSFMIVEEFFCRSFHSVYDFHQILLKDE